MSEVPDELVVLRGAIDNMDAALIHLLDQGPVIGERDGAILAFDPGLASEIIPESNITIALGEGGEV